MIINNNRYKMLQYLDEGIQGVTFKYKDINNNKFVVIKFITIKNTYMNEDKSLKRIFNTYGNRCDGVMSYIIRYHDSGIFNKRDNYYNEVYNLIINNTKYLKTYITYKSDIYFIISDFINGYTSDIILMNSWSKSEEYSKTLSIKFVHDILIALIFIHSLNITHRDIKPNNIMYDIDRDIFILIDFGNAEIYDEKISNNDLSYLLEIIDRYCSIPEFNYNLIVKKYNPDELFSLTALKSLEILYSNFKIFKPTSDDIINTFVVKERWKLHRVKNTPSVCAIYKANRSSRCACGISL